MNELTLKDKALRLDNEMQMWAGTMTTAVYNIGRCMSQIKEENLYIELGYATFEDYCEEKYQLKKSQAAKYISVFNNLDEQYILDNQTAGIQKLYMISQISEEDRANIEGDLSETSVTELKAEIERIRQEREGLQLQLDGLMEEKKEEDLPAKRRIEELTRKLEEAEKEAQSYKAQSDKAAKLMVDKEMLQTRADQLEQKLKELEEKPVEVAMQEPSEEELNARAEKIAEERIREAEQKLKAAEEELKAEKDASEKFVQKKIEEAEKKAKEASDKFIESYEERLKAKETEIENIKSGYEKKLKNLFEVKEKNEESTQMDVPAEDTATKMKSYLGAVVSAANQAIQLAADADDPGFWKDKLKSTLQKMIDAI